MPAKACFFADEGVFADGVIAFGCPSAVLFFGVVVLVVVEACGSPSTPSRKPSSFLYTAGLHGGLPVVGGSRSCTRSPRQAISAQAYERAISSSGFRLEARLRDCARRDALRLTSRGGSGFVVGRRLWRGCWADMVGFEMQQVAVLLALIAL